MTNEAKTWFPLEEALGQSAVAVSSCAAAPAQDCRTTRFGGRQNIVKLFQLLLLGSVVSGLAANGSNGQPSVVGGGVLERARKEPPAARDFVRFTNGDVLTGEIEGIAEGVVTVKPEMAAEALLVPVGALKEIVLKESENEGSFPADRLVLMNGESIAARVEGMKENRIALLLPCSERAELDAEKVAAVAFYREEEVLGEEEFDSGLPERMRFEGGRWSTLRGWLIQGDSRATECLACLPLTQTGELVYEWVVNTTIGGSTGMYFMASDPGLLQERAYFVRVLRNYVYVYYCTNGQEVYCGSYRISLYKSKNEVQLRCDSDRGLVEIRIDGTEVGRWRSSAPIKMGKYVILRTEGRAAFDSLKVVRKRGAPRPEAGDNPGDRDRLVLVNGDIIVAEVKGISERSVKFAAYNGEAAGEIERDKLLWARFRRELQPLPTAKDGTVVFVTRGGDRISGKALFLDGEVARIKSDLAGVVDLRRKDVKKVIFKEVP